MCLFKKIILLSFALSTISFNFAQSIIQSPPTTIGDATDAQRSLDWIAEQCKPGATPDEDAVLGTLANIRIFAQKAPTSLMQQIKNQALVHTAELRANLLASNMNATWNGIQDALTDLNDPDNQDTVITVALSTILGMDDFQELTAKATSNNNIQPSLKNASYHFSLILNAVAECWLSTMLDNRKAGLSALQSLTGDQNNIESILDISTETANDLFYTSVIKRSLDPKHIQLQALTQLCNDVRQNCTDILKATNKDIESFCSTSAKDLKPILDKTQSAAFDDKADALFAATDARRTYENTKPSSEVMKAANYVEKAAALEVVMAP